MRKGFISYAHKDEKLAQILIKRIAFLKKPGIIDAWSDMELNPGDEAEKEISAKIDEAEIILLFVSPDFLESYHCYEVELQRALERQARNEARIIPIILRAANWELAPFRGLESIPAKNSPPLSKVKAADRDEAFADVVRKIERVAKLMGKGRPSETPAQDAPGDDFPAVTVCTITKRMNPGFARMLELLKAQDFRSFEWVIVDGYYHVRRDRMLEMIERQSPSFPVRYVPPKPSPWANVRPALSNALNTALIWARGKTIVELDDCCREMSTDWLQAHVTSNLKGFALTGSYATAESVDGRRDSFSEPSRIGPEHFYAAHRSYPLSKALNVNGYEELLDGEQGQSDIVMAFMLAQAGVKFMYDPNLVINFDSEIHSLTQFSPDPVKRRWPREPWIAEPKTRVMEDGSPHYSNEWLAQKIRRELWARPRGNNFDLATLRDFPARHEFVIEAVQKELAAFQSNNVDWRDEQAVEDVPGGEFLTERNPDVVISQQPVKRAVISPSGSHVAVATKGRITRYFPKARRSETVESDFDWKAIYLCPASNRIIALARFARIYGGDFAEMQDLPPSKDELHAVAISASEKLLATGGWDRQVRLWDVSAGKPLLITDRLSGSVTALGFLADDRLLAATSSGTVETIDTATGEISCSETGFRYPITALACHCREGKSFYLVGSQDGELSLMSNTGCLPLKKAHAAQVNSLHISRCGQFGVSGDSKGTALIWYIPGRLLLEKIELTQPVLAAHLDTNNDRLNLVVASGLFHSWTINSRVGRNLFIPNLEAVIAET